MRQDLRVTRVVPGCLQVRCRCDVWSASGLGSSRAANDPTRIQVVITSVTQIPVEHGAASGLSSTAHRGSALPGSDRSDCARRHLTKPTKKTTLTTVTATAAVTKATRDICAVMMSGTATKTK